MPEPETNDSIFNPLNERKYQKADSVKCSQEYLMYVRIKRKKLHSIQSLQRQIMYENPNGIKR